MVTRAIAGAKEVPRVVQVEPGGRNGRIARNDATQVM